jgi:predicted AlkP superfamily pyrophosphatase or phosphodiesterase
MKSTIALALAFITNIATSQVSNLKPIVTHVVLISIDGLHPDMYMDKSWHCPNLRQLMKRGTYADHLKSVFPAYTYPSHTAMLTGALPARSGIYFNQPRASQGEWNWFTNYIKVPTLWQALKAKGMATAAVEWPVSVGNEITYDIPEIWDIDHPDDRITEARKYAGRGLIEEIEQNATGRLDSANMNDNDFSLDENAGRIAGYVFSKYKPAFMALHFESVDGEEHDYGRDADSVRLALEVNDRAIGDVLQGIKESGEEDSTVVIIVGDHGFCTIHQVLRPNILIKDLQVKFIAAGGSAFLYGNVKDVSEVIRRLDSLPKNERKKFRIIERNELDRMGADSSALLAIAAVPGIVFSGAVKKNAGPGTVIQQNNTLDLISPTKGGHHGYDPDIHDMWTGFIAAGSGIRNGASIKELCVTDIAPLIAKLLGLEFNAPDGKLVDGILDEQH